MSKLDKILKGFTKTIDELRSYQSENAATVVQYEQAIEKAEQHKAFHAAEAAKAEVLLGRMTALVEV